ncbi:MerR family transcriptional regulator [Anaerofustis sp.]|uniref:MerR family transcriptional regulator n=1 Tax=Anaerofustis sp. TaxID=1872517 RepID=UPI0025B96FA0|nr:MerR family transcriptional regulator [Anaerofustis sp.]
MKETYNIGTISKILNIPKSTLRYWEKEGIINLKRNAVNEYREFSVSSIFEILDIFFYRKLNISIKELKKIETQNLYEIGNVFRNNKKNIQKEIKNLKETIRMIDDRLEQIDIFNEIKNSPYQIKNKIENVNYVVEFEFTNKEILEKYTSHPGHFVYFIDNNSKNFNYGFITKSIKEKDTVLWENDGDGKKQYARFLLKQDYYKLTTDIKKHQNELNKMGFDTGKTIARYLLTDYEKGKYDYYEAYMEIEKKKDI